MRKMMTSVSVIVPTKDRPRELEFTVRTLLLQTTLPLQLIIVDQSSGTEGRDRVDRLYASLVDRSGGALELCYIMDETIPGANVARNRAIDAATGDIVLFLDDDVILEPDFIEEIVAAYARRPDAAGISGVITNYQRPQLLFGLWTSLFVRGPFLDKRQAVYWNADGLRNSEPIPVDRFGEGLMSFRAEAIRNCRFDENVRVCYGEDVDFCSQLKPNSILLIAPRARLVHSKSPIGRLHDHFLRRQVRSACFLYWKNWNHGFKNALSFFWLNVGYILLAMVGSMLRLSLEPWRAIGSGIRDARAALERTAMGMAVTTRGSCAS